MEKTLLLSIYIIIESLYIITCIKALLQIRIYLRNNGEFKTLSLSLCLMLVCGIIATILRPICEDHIVTKIVFTSFFIFELLNLYLIKEYALKSKIIKKTLTLLLLLCLIYLIIIGISHYNTNSFNIFFVFESLIAGTISLLYFIQLSSSISTKNLNEDPMTFIMLALFFCFGMPLSYTSSFISFEYMNPDYLKSLNRSDAIVMFLISRIGTICYIVFNLFIIKALKCKQIFHIGYL